NSPGLNTTCNLFPEGGQVTYTVTVTNGSNFGNIVVDQVCDSAYGKIYRSSTAPSTLAQCAAGGQCAAPNNVPGTGCATSTTCNATTLGDIATTGTCTFTVTQDEALTVTDIVSISGHGASAGTFGPVNSNSVMVISHEALTTATVTKGFVSTTAGCATVR